MEHARSYKNVLKHRAKTNMLWYRNAKKCLTETEQSCAAFYERNKELEERCENLEHRKYALESKDEVSESELQQLQEQLKNATDNANKYRELWCEAQQKVWNSQWISVKDGLPKHNDNYAVVLEGVECIVPFDDCGQEFGWWERTYNRNGGADGEEFTKNNRPQDATLKGVSLRPPICQYSAILSCIGLGSEQSFGASVRLVVRTV